MQPIIALALNHAAERFEFPAAHVVAGDVFDCEGNQPGDKVVESRIVNSEPTWQRGNSRRISVEQLFEAASSFRQRIPFRAKSRYPLNCRINQADEICRDRPRIALVLVGQQHECEIALRKSEQVR